jgi:hypothetical protein
MDAVFMYAFLQKEPVQLSSWNIDAPQAVSQSTVNIPTWLMR